MANHELDQLRKQVDEINLQLLHLLNKRGEIVQKIGEQKQVQGTKRFDPVREREVLDMIAEHN
ncbi:TPA: chorismate mutase, partial [Bacillus wiedmannii]|nr:chorismate mutase [Bacillus wiedmannii]